MSSPASTRSAEIQQVEYEALSFDYSTEGMQTSERRRLTGEQLRYHESTSSTDDLSNKEPEQTSQSVSASNNYSFVEKLPHSLNDIHHRQVATDSPHHRQVATDSPHHRQVATDSPHHRQVATDSPHHRQVATDSPHHRQVATDDSPHHRQVATDSPHHRQVATDSPHHRQVATDDSPHHRQVATDSPRHRQVATDDSPQVGTDSPHDLIVPRGTIASHLGGSTVQHQSALSSHRPVPSAMLQQQPVPSSMLQQQPVSSMLQQQPVSSMLQQQPVSSMLQQQPVSSMLQQQPVSSMLQQQPVSSMLQQQPVSSMLQQQPVSSMLQQRPIPSAMLQQQPVPSSMLQQQPVFSMLQQQPVSSMLQQRPIPSAMLQQQPVPSSMLQQQPVSSMLQQQPVPSSMLQQQPVSSMLQQQLPSLLLQQQPVSSMLQQQPVPSSMLQQQPVPLIQQHPPSPRHIQPPPLYHPYIPQHSQFPLPHHLAPHVPLTNDHNQRYRSHSLSPPHAEFINEHKDNLAPPTLLSRSLSDPKDSVVQSGTESYNDLLGSGKMQSSYNFFEKPEVQFQLKKETGIPTMTYFVAYVVRSIPNKWREFGLSLKIDPVILDGIERKYSGRDPQQFFIEVFRHWESNKNELLPFLWTTVADILENNLSEHALANRVRFLSPMTNQQHMDHDNNYPLSLPSTLNTPQPQVMHPSSLSTSKAFQSSNIIPSPDIHYQFPQMPTNAPQNEIPFSSLPAQIPTVPIQPQLLSNNFFQTSPYTVVSPVPVSSSSDIPSSQVILNASSPEQEKSSSTFYSATDDGPASLPAKFDSWTELLQKYMSNLEEKSAHPPFIRPSSPNEHRSLSPQIPQRISSAKPAKEEKMYLQKELDKAYERISALEVRVQDLTAQVTCDIPEDNELAQLPPEKLDQDFRKMRELKKKAEQQSMDAKQAAQRLVAENFRLKEELSQIKNDRDMLIMELRRHRRRNNESDQFRDEKIETMRKSLRKAVRDKLKDFENEISFGQSVVPLPLVKDFSTKDFTPKLLWDIIKKEKSTLRLGQVIVVGLPSTGKSTLVKSLLQKEVGGSNLKSKGQPTCMEFYEIMMQNDPLTNESQWKVTAGIDFVVQYLSRVSAQHFFHQKQTPSFVNEDISESVASLFPDVKDANIKETFHKIFKDVQAVLQKEKKKDGLIHLALNKPVFVNLWDVSVNRCLYQLLPEVASFCAHLVVLDVIDLERDVPYLDEPPVLSSEKYKERGDNKTVMHIYSRLEYFMLFAGIKHWMNNSTNEVPEAHEIVIVGTHTSEFAARDDGKALRDAINQLKYHITAVANKIGIANVIDSRIVTYCIDGNKDRQSKDLTTIKKSIEKLVNSQPNCEVPIDVNWTFFRSVFYNYSDIVISRHTLRRDARTCGIYADQKLHDCLVMFRNVGSIGYAPEIEGSFMKSHVLWSIPQALEALDHLFYLPYYQSSNNISLSQEEEQGLKQYRYGLVSKAMADKVFKKHESRNLLEFLVCCNVCCNVNGESDLYFMPSLRTKYRTSKPHSSSLYVQQFHSHYATCDQLVIFPKYFDKVFTSVNFIPCEDFNVLSLSCVNDDKEINFEIIYHPQFIEVHVLKGDNDECLLNLSLCSKLKHLCKLVYDHLCTVIYNLTYKFGILCPNSEKTSCPHLIFFDSDSELTLFCETCSANILISDESSNWLMSKIVKQ